MIEDCECSEEVGPPTPIGESLGMAWCSFQCMQSVPNIINIFSTLSYCVLHL